MTDFRPRFKKTEGGAQRFLYACTVVADSTLAQVKSQCRDWHKDYFQQMGAVLGVLSLNWGIIRVVGRVKEAISSA